LRIDRPPNKVRPLALAMTECCRRRRRSHPSTPLTRWLLIVTVTRHRLPSGSRIDRPPADRAFEVTNHPGHVFNIALCLTTRWDTAMSFHVTRPGVIGG